MQQKTRIRAIAFDVDGTLYPAFSLYLRSIDIFLKHPRLVPAFSSARRHLRELQRRPDYAPSNREDLHRLQAGLLAARLGTSERGARDLTERIFYNEIPRRFAAIRPYSGAISVIEALREQGFMLAALSDLPPDEKIAALGFNGVFGKILCSEDYGVLKPHPRAFGALSGALGVAPMEILYVGNNVEYDIGGSKRAGMRAALRGRFCPSADFSFRKWSDFGAWALSNFESA